MGDGIGGPVIRCMSGNTFELDVTHYRKDNQEQYSRIEKIIISKIDPQKYSSLEVVSLDNLPKDWRTLERKIQNCIRK